MLCLPYDQFTMAFARDVLEGKKELLKITDAQHINWPAYDEVSVKKLWPEFREREEVSKYFPEYIPDGRQIDKNYFFTVLNTVLHEEVQEIKKYANDQRFIVQDEEDDKKHILMTEEWHEKMMKHPF